MRRAREGGGGTACAGVSDAEVERRQRAVEEENWIRAEQKGQDEEGEKTGEKKKIREGAE
jgi:hypothetical protein